MKNFNVYDPMKRGQGLVLDGQTLAHIEMGTGPIFWSFLYLTTLAIGSAQ